MARRLAWVLLAVLASLPACLAYTSEEPIGLISTPIVHQPSDSAFLYTFTPDGLAVTDNWLVTAYVQFPFINTLACPRVNWTVSGDGTCQYYRLEALGSFGSLVATVEANQDAVVVLSTGGSGFGLTHIDLETRAFVHHDATATTSAGYTPMSVAVWRDPAGVAPTELYVAARTASPTTPWIRRYTIASDGTLVTHPQLNVSCANDGAMTTTWDNFAIAVGEDHVYLTRSVGTPATFVHTYPRTISGDVTCVGTTLDIPNDINQNPRMPAKVVDGTLWLASATFGTDAVSTWFKTALPNATDLRPGFENEVSLLVSTRFPILPAPLGLFSMVIGASVTPYTLDYSPGFATSGVVDPDGWEVASTFQNTAFFTNGYRDPRVIFDGDGNPTHIVAITRAVPAPGNFAGETSAVIVYEVNAGPKVVEILNPEAETGTGAGGTFLLQYTAPTPSIFTRAVLRLDAIIPPGAEPYMIELDTSTLGGVTEIPLLRTDQTDSVSILVPMTQTVIGHGVYDVSVCVVDVFGSEPGGLDPMNPPNGCTTNANVYIAPESTAPDFTLSANETNPLSIDGVAVVGRATALLLDVTVYQRPALVRPLRMDISRASACANILSIDLASPTLDPDLNPGHASIPIDILPALADHFELDRLDPELDGDYYVSLRYETLSGLVVNSPVSKLFRVDQYTEAMEVSEPTSRVYSGDYHLQLVYDIPATEHPDAAIEGHGAASVTFAPVAGGDNITVPIVRRAPVSVCVWAPPDRAPVPSACGLADGPHLDLQTIPDGVYTVVFSHTDARGNPAVTTTVPNVELFFRAPDVAGEPAAGNADAGFSVSVPFSSEPDSANAEFTNTETGSVLVVPLNLVAAFVDSGSGAGTLVAPIGDGTLEAPYYAPSGPAALVPGSEYQLVFHAYFSPGDAELTTPPVTIRVPGDSTCRSALGTSTTAFGAGFAVGAVSTIAVSLIVMMVLRASASGRYAVV